jgi:uncharacterized protein YbcC (UPF0753/DUF2309 family)
MSAIEDKKMVTPSESQRIELRSLVNLSCEPISHFWPMKTFIHHNPLHGLEHMPFEKAINEGQRFLRGRGYLSNSENRKFFKQGRVSEESIKDALGSITQEESVTLGDQKFSHREVLRAILINGTGKVATDVCSAILQPSLHQPEVKNLFDKIYNLSKGKTPSNFLKGHSEREKKELATQYTLAEWCDQTFRTNIQDQINNEIIKWVGGFLDEGHAPWGMPMRKKTFYRAWKELALDDASGALLGILDWKNKIQSMPDRPEDAVLESLSLLAIPKNLWEDYFSLQLAQLSGWTGFIKWRSEQTDYEWQNSFPIDLVKYMAIRLFYERELVMLACQEKLAISGTYASINEYLKNHSTGYGLYKEFRSRVLPDEVVDFLNISLFTQNPLNIDALDRCDSRLISTWEETREKQEVEGQALMVMHIAQSLGVSIEELAKSTSDALSTLLGWVERFPESEHGPIWLEALESSYIKGFAQKISPNLEKLIHSDEVDEVDGKPPESRPLSQAIFCIDVRSECFRRNLEEIGGNETFGFAGFFGVPICYQGFSSEQQTDQCPVLLKPKHIVKEIPRAYQGKAAERFLEGQQIAKAGHTLLHDLKENVVTPYVMVEAIGWFFGFKLFGQTLLPKWFKNSVSWIKETLAIPIRTTITVDKIQRDDAYEMVAVKYRAAIYRLLTEKYGQQGAAVPHDQVERIRKLALNQTQADIQESEELFRLLKWNDSDLEQFIAVLRNDFNLQERDLDHQIQGITQAGFTLSEQVNYVETALRLLGFTKTFARLILLCAHGSTSDNNPYESALDCGACGGNHGISNARALAVMANNPQVRQRLAERGITIPHDTHFLPGQQDTVTDEVELFDLEEVPATHRKDLVRLQQDLQEACEKNSRERLARLPDVPSTKEIEDASSLTMERSIDWSQVRPEWGLSGHTAFVMGRRLLTQGINFEGRTFLHSYDHSQDPDGKYLEIIMTAPMIVTNWINMEHYFSTVDPIVYGAGSKVYHNVVGNIGVMYGSQSDLCVGLPIQTIFDGDKPYHEPMRLFAIIEAPLERIENIVGRHNILQRLTGNRWINLVALDPDSKKFFLFRGPKDWQPIH